MTMTDETATTSPVAVTPDVAPHSGVTAGRTGRWVERWEPEDEQFWETTGKRVARRNLAFSIFAENLGFTVWSLWSVVVVSLPAAGFNFSTDKLLWLVALPNLIGAVLRLPYTFAVPKFGGRNWTVATALMLLLPLGLLAACVSQPGTPYWMFLVAAATAGLGGGNFASSMANISFFYPEKRKGFALGLNAAGGNLGVAVVQLMVPLAVTVGALAVVGGSQGSADGRDDLHVQNAALMWVPLVLLAAFCAWRWMDNLRAATSPLSLQVVVARRSQTWLIAVIYIGTFGSFIGFSSAFPLLIQSQFPDVTVAHYAFLGALVGAVARPFGGWLADRLGGARITAASFVVMGAGAVLALRAIDARSWPGYLAAFLLLFLASGIGNGSTFRMIPVIFREQALTRAAAEGQTQKQAVVTGRREAAAVLGITGAVGALGGFLVPRGFGMSIAQTGGIGAAFYAFLAFYTGCLGLTWWCYLRTRVLVHRVPSLAHAGV